MFAFLITLLGREVFADIEVLATAQTDDIRWNMSQLEVELLRVQLTAQAPADGGGIDLDTFRQRFDIFYSRVATLSQSPLHSAMRADPQAAIRLASAWDFLEATTPLVDGPESELIEALPYVRTRLDELLPDIRRLALFGVETSVQSADRTRNDISATLIDLAVALLGLILALTFTIFVLARLYRQGQVVANENKIVKSRFEAAVKSSLDAVLVIDTSGRIIEFNGAAETVFGYSRHEALGSEMTELLVPPSQRELHRKGFERFHKTGGKGFVGAGRVRMEGMRKSGEFFPVELTISLAKTDEQSVFVSFLRDITNELKAEEELRSARDKAQAGEKAKSDLLTVMSHEMRTPLNGILGSLSLINHDNLTDRQLRHLNSIGISGELLLSHVNDVLDLSKLDANVTELRQVEFDLPQMIDRVTDSLQGNARLHRNTLHATLLCQDVQRVSGCQTELQQCLINLVGNAIKFNRDSEVRIEVEQLPASDIFEFRVSDNGVGICSDNLERIFEEFVTIDTGYARENQGTGLGLAITHRLVKAMGGDIEVESIEGEGSLFSFRVPLTSLSGLVRSQAAPEAATQNASLDGRSALVVEDNRINRMILADMLEDLGCQVTEASDGYQGIKAAEQEEFDILLLDISMPGLDGIETLNLIRSGTGANCETPAMAVTAHAAKKDRDRFLAAEFSGVLIKPVPPDLLEEKLLEVLGVDAVDHRAPVEGDDDVTSQFIERFGKDEFEKSTSGLLAEISELLLDLGQSRDLQVSLIEKVHRVAGSAAILGFVGLREELQAIEGYEGENWSVDRQCHLDDLQTHLQALASQFDLDAWHPGSNLPT